MGIHTCIYTRFAYSECESGCETLGSSDDHGGQLSVFQLSIIVVAAVVVVGVAAVIFIVFKRPSVCKHGKEASAVTPEEEPSSHTDPTGAPSKVSLRFCRTGVSGWAGRGSVCVCVCVCVCARACIHTHIHTHAHPYTPTHTHTH